MKTSRPKKSPSSRARKVGRVTPCAPSAKPRTSARRGLTRPTTASVRRAFRDWHAAFRQTLRPGLERDTELMPWLVAESVCAEVERFLDVELPARYAVWIEARAELCYARQRHFRKRMRGSGNAPRNQLRVFMRHWLAGLLHVERPDLFECLPETFTLGRSLPPAVRPRRRWVGNGEPLHAARDWNPERVLQHRRWHWLSKWLPTPPDAEKATLQNAVTATDQQIDQLVYELYGLTPEEIALVEGGQPLSA